MSDTTERPSAARPQLLTYRYRLKDGRSSDTRALRAQARAVTYVWNYLCEIQRKAEAQWAGGAKAHWPSYFDLTTLTAGSCRDLGISAETVLAVCRQFVISRDANRGHPHWRSVRKSLAWVPFRHANRLCRFDQNGVTFRKRHYRLWWSRDLPESAVLKEGSFSCDARGRWYFNAVVETSLAPSHGNGEIGIDLGLIRLATTSAGETIPNLKHMANYAEDLAKASRSRRKNRIRAVYAKIANSRRDHLHKVSTAIMRANRRVIVGNVSPSKLAKTKFAKSVLDAGWSSFRTMLRYKAIKHGVEYEEVNEAWTSRTCSACGSLPASSPKGMGALGIREWRCDDCGTVHDRDVNAARNILALGAARRPPAEGIAA